MKRIIKLAAMGVIFLFSGIGQAAKATTVSYPFSAGKSSLDLPGYFMEMQLSEFIKVTAKDYQLVTGKKMTLKERVAFSMLKKNMKKSLKKNEDQKVKDYIATMDKGEKTALIIIIVVVVVVVAAVIISSINTIGPFYTGGL